MKKIILSILVFTVLACWANPYSKIASASVTGGGGGGGVAGSDDTFNRADANPMTTTASDGVSTWVNGPGGLGDLRTISNQAVGTTETLDGAVISSPDFADNQFSEVVFGTTTLGGRYIGAGVRIQGTTDCRGYYLYATDPTTLVLCRIDDNIAPELITVGAYLFPTMAVGDTIRLEVSGNLFTIKHNGSTLDTRTDSTYTTGQPGVLSAFNGKIDGFSAGDL